jgi:pimeloyl-ACP methyl ester carboxylesterase
MPLPADERPVLVLLPGMDGTGLMFGPFLAVLEGLEAQVLRYPPELTAYADCVAYARARLPLGRPFLLLGESFSGPVAITLAAEQPEGLAGLVLCSTFARSPHPGLSWAAPLVRALPSFRMSHWLVRFLLLGSWTTAPLVALANSLSGAVPSATMKARLLAVAAVDATPLLGRIQAPTLALCASQDRLVPKASDRWTKAHLPDLESLLIPGPHWLLQACPEATARAIEAFLRRIQAAAADKPGTSAGVESTEEMN